jgi:hypothetical protein
LKDAGWQREHMSKNRLAILPNVTHYEMFMSPALVATILQRNVQYEQPDRHGSRTDQSGYYSFAY